MLGLLIFIVFLGLPKSAFAPTIPYQSEFYLIEENSIKAAISPCFNAKFGLMSDFFDEIDVEYLKELIREKYPELNRIIECESNWKNICNQKYGCYAGIGLAQIIPSTWKFAKLNGLAVDDPFNEVDNLLTAIWLYENYGNKPWSQSQKCWINSNGQKEKKEEEIIFIKK